MSSSCTCFPELLFRASMSLDLIRPTVKYCSWFLDVLHVYVSVNCKNHVSVFFGRFLCAYHQNISGCFLFRTFTVLQAAFSNLVLEYYSYPADSISSVVNFVTFRTVFVLGTNN